MQADHPQQGCAAGHRHLFPGRARRQHRLSCRARSVSIRRRCSSREGIDAQIQQVFRNLRAVAAAAGATLDDAVKVNVFLTDLGALRARSTRSWRSTSSSPIPRAPRWAWPRCRAARWSRSRRCWSPHPEPASTRPALPPGPARPGPVATIGVRRPAGGASPSPQPSVRHMAPARAAAQLNSAFTGVPEATRKLLEKLGLRTDLDLVLHLPLRYEDETHLTRLRDALSGQQRAGRGGGGRGADPVPPQAHPGVPHARRRRGADRCASSTSTRASCASSRPASRLRVMGELKRGFFGAEMIHPALLGAARGRAAARGAHARSIRPPPAWRSTRCAS